MRTLVLATVAIAALIPAPASAQYAELTPRRAGVRPPWTSPWVSSLDRDVLAIPSAEAFARSHARIPRLGRFPLLVIPALFSDSPEPHVSRDAIQRSLFDGPTVRGTVTAYFREVSMGKLEVVGEVAPWVRTSVTRLEAAGPDGTFGERLRDYVRQALRLADDAVDFGAFDNDGPDGVPNSGDDNGVVDAVAIEFLDPAGSCGGPGIWPHLGGLSEADGQPFLTQDPTPGGGFVRVSFYISDSVAECDGLRVQGPAVMAHEFGHVLGLPDYYRQAEGLQPQQRHWAVGCFDLMGAGSWGCGTGVKQEDFGPTHPSALSKERLGWLELERVGDVTDREYVLDPVQTSGRALEIPLTADGTESFLVEYRTREGFDRDLPGEGVLVYHYDRYQGLRWVPEGLPPAYAYHLVEADGDDALRKLEREGGNRGSAADLWGVPGAPSDLGPATTPSTRDHVGRRTPVVIEDIRVEGGRARLRVSTRAGFAVVERTATPAAQATFPFEARMRVIGGELPLSVEVSPTSPLPEGLSARVEGPEVVVDGVLLQVGALVGELVIRDARGLELVERLGVGASDPPLRPPELLAEVATGVPSLALGPAERAYLDNAGNRNGRLDVGDVRAYLRRTGQVPGG